MPTDDRAARLAAPLTSDTWRVGGKQPHNIYENDMHVLVALGDRGTEAQAMAARVVRVMNAADYCDVCGNADGNLSGPVEVCRTCLSAAEYACDMAKRDRDRAEAKLAAAEGRESRLRVILQTTRALLPGISGDIENCNEARAGERLAFLERLIADALLDAPAKDGG